VGQKHALPQCNLGVRCTPISGLAPDHQPKLNSGVVNRTSLLSAHWQERKEAYIAHLSNADQDILLVSLADKVHNARSILRDLRKPEVGKSIWDRFSQPKDKTLWYYRSLAAKFRAALPGQLADELNEIVGVLERSG
jgi:hypothetical protein